MVRGRTHKATGTTAAACWCWITVILLQSLLHTRLSELGINPHLDDDIEETRQMAREIMTQLHSSPLATPTLNRLMEVLELTTH